MCGSVGSVGSVAQVAGCQLRGGVELLARSFGGAASRQPAGRSISGRAQGTQGPG